MAIPASVGFFFHTMFNVVDTYYGGKISTEAQAILSMSFPLYFLIVALGAGISKGTTAMVSHALGAKQNKQAEVICHQAILLAVLTSVVISLAATSYLRPLFIVLGAREQYLDNALDYIRVIYWGALFFICTNVLNGMLTSIGDTKSFRNFLIVGFFLNLALDPWFMSGGFGVPAMGLRGIGLATVVVEAIGVAYLLVRTSNSGLLALGRPSLFAPDWAVQKELLLLGLPSALSMSSIAVGMFLVTIFVSDFGQTAIAAYGVATRVEQIILLPSIGLNFATLALVAQSSGAKDMSRARMTVRICLRYGMTIIAVGSAALFFFGEELMSLFSQDAEVIKVGANYLWISAFGLWSYVVLYITSSTLQGLKRPMLSLVVGASRQMLVPLVFLPIFISLLHFGLSWIWWTIVGVNSSIAFVSFWLTHKALAERQVEIEANG